MWSDGIPSGSQTALVSALACEALRAPGAQAAIDAAFLRQVAGPGTSFFNPPTVVCPPFYVGQANGATVIVIGPTQNLDMAINLFNGYLRLTGPAFSSPTNPAIVAAANYILSQMAVNHVSVPRQLLLVGYSMGGAIAEQLAAMLTSSGVVVPNVINFGAPRPAGRSTINQMRSSLICRYMVDADPIPNFPPRLQDMPGVASVFGVANALGFEGFLHPHGGLLLHADGSRPVAAETPPDASLAAVLGFPAFLLGQVTGTMTPHAITNYVTQIQTWIALQGSTNPTPPHSAPAERLNPTGRAGMNATERVQTALVFRQAEIQDGPAPVNPPTLAFKAIRFGAVWQVVFQNTVVATGPSKKKARGLARALNDGMRRLGRQAVVDPVALAAQITAYITAAGDPTSGIVPTINAVWPV